MGGGGRLLHTPSVCSFINGAFEESMRGGSECPGVMFRSQLIISTPSLLPETRS